MTSSRTTSPWTFALLHVSMAAICAFGVIATLSTLIPGSPSRGELAQVTPVELDGGQGARGGHEGSEPDRRDGKRPQGNAFAEPEEQASVSQSQAAGSTAEPAPAPAVVVAPDPAGEATAAPSTTSSRDDDATGDRDKARGDDGTKAVDDDD